MEYIKILSYVHALRPILYFQSQDFRSIDDIICKISGEAHIYEFREGLGPVDFATKSFLVEEKLSQFLDTNKDNGYSQETFLILKDVHNKLQDPDVIALLKYIAERTLYTSGYQQTVVIVSGECIIPNELEHLITIVSQNKPTQGDIENIIHGYAKDLDFSIDEKEVGDLALELKGFSFFQIKQVLDLAYTNGGIISINDKDFILSEKKQIVCKSGLLEYIDSIYDIDSVGGLEELKKWLYRKAQIFHNLDSALKNGVDIPKGMLIVGFPGCGKSLTAKTTAALFKVPLLRLDVGRILGKYVGESERNMRSALAQAEAVSPCVLWVDEVEKAFAGGTGSSGHEVTTRLIGQFLTWMQEKTSTVFVVATANDLERLPTEFLRKGRFDEIFSVALPTPQERLQVLKIHLMKRKKYYAALNLSEVVEKTDGFSGADLEAGIAAAVEELFIKYIDSTNNEKMNNAIHKEDLLKVFDKIKPLSSALENKFKLMEKKLNEYNVRPAAG